MAGSRLYDKLKKAAPLAELGELSRAEGGAKGFISRKNAKPDKANTSGLDAEDQAKKDPANSVSKKARGGVLYEKGK